jgi:hypothetical protein
MPRIEFLIRRITAAVLAFFLTNSFWLIGCQDALTAPIIVAGTDNANVPDCCKHGICPHHAPQHQNKETNGCPCMSSRDAVTMTAFMLAPAIAPMAVAVLPVTSPVDSPWLQSSPIPITPDLLLFTPPPRA